MNLVLDLDQGPVVHCTVVAFCHVTCHVTSVVGLPIEQILAYLIDMELNGSVFGAHMLLPLFSELTATELEEQLEEDEGLASLVM